MLVVLDSRRQELLVLPRVPNGGGWDTHDYSLVSCVKGQNSAVQCLLVLAARRTNHHETEYWSTVLHEVALHEKRIKLHNWVRGAHQHVVTLSQMSELAPRFPPWPAQPPTPLPTPSAADLDLESDSSSSDLAILRGRPVRRRPPASDVPRGTASPSLKDIMGHLDAAKDWVNVETTQTIRQRFESLGSEGF